MNKRMCCFHLVEGTLIYIFKNYYIIIKKDLKQDSSPLTYLYC